MDDIESTPASSCSPPRCWCGWPTSCTCPSPIVLVLGGLGIALVPGLPDDRLCRPRSIFLVFLPPLVHAAGWSPRRRSCGRCCGRWPLLAVGLVFLTAAVVAVVAHALVPEMGWAAAAVLGAIAGPDRRRRRDRDLRAARRAGAGAAAGRGRVDDQRRHRARPVPDRGRGRHRRRLQRSAVRRWSSSATPPAASLVGLARRLARDAVIRRQTDASLVILITVLTAYGAYIGAEEIHASGILAAVVAGLLRRLQHAAHDGRRHAPDRPSRSGACSCSASRSRCSSCWALQLPDDRRGARRARRDLASCSAGRGDRGGLDRDAAGLGLPRCAAMPATTWRERFVVGWSGMRGAVSLAAALAVPLEVPSAARDHLHHVRPDPHHPRRPGALAAAPRPRPANLRGAAAGARRRRRRGWRRRRPRSTASTRSRRRAAPARHSSQRLRDLYRTRFRMCAAVLGGEDPGGGRPRAAPRDYGQLRRELIETRARGAAASCAGGQACHSQTLRQIERDLDLEEARVRV